MATITLSYDKRCATARKKEESPYNPDFVKKINESRKEYKEGKYVVIDDIKDLWNVINEADDETGIKRESKD